MPYQMIHLLIANAFAEKNPALSGTMLSNSSEFFLGVIAPDAIHARAPKTTAAEKYGTHLKPTGPDGLKEVQAYWMAQGRSSIKQGNGSIEQG